MQRIVTITGPSCAGKSTLESLLVQRGFARAISTTSRRPRAGETDGYSYHFVSEQLFNRMVAEGAMVESVKFAKASYGVTAAEIDRLFAEGDNVVIVCEPVGAKQIAAWCVARGQIHLTQVFLDNAQDVINERFLRRATDEISRASMSGPANGIEARVVKTYAERMKTMMTVEQEWRREALSDSHPTYGTSSWRYDVVIPLFDKSNAKEIADSIAKGLPILC